MKSRYDFGTDDQYYEYLVHYYMGQILCNAQISEDVKELYDIYRELNPGEIAADYAYEMAKCVVERIKKGV